VNYRTEPATPISYHKTRPYFPGGRTNEQRTANEGDRIAQMDIEHMGLMS
jgi:hypothetical protein